jgi:hypothetical protein
MKLTTRIKTADLSVRTLAVAETYGFSTVGQMYRFLKKANPHAQLCVRGCAVRVSRLLEELDRELS